MGGREHAPLGSGPGPTCPALRRAAQDDSCVAHPTLGPGAGGPSQASFLELPSLVTSVGGGRGRGSRWSEHVISWAERGVIDVPPFCCLLTSLPLSHIPRRPSPIHCSTVPLLNTLSLSGQKGQSQRHMVLLGCDWNQPPAKGHSETMGEI